MSLCYLHTTPTSWSSLSTSPLKCAVCLDDEKIALSDIILIQKLLGSIDSQIRDIENENNTQKCQEILEGWLKALKPLKDSILKLLETIEQKITS